MSHSKINNPMSVERNWARQQGG